MSAPRRVLVATDHERYPRTALDHARALVGGGGEVVLAAVLVVPLAQPLDAALERKVNAACAVLDQAERGSGAGPFDTRLVRARSFAEGVLQTLAGEPFDVVLVEKRHGALPNGPDGQIDTLMDKADATVVLVRPA